MAIRGKISNRRSISSTPSHSEPHRGHQRSSEALEGTQTQSQALRRSQRQSPALSSTRWPSAAPQRAPGPETATRIQIASAIIGGATAARTRPFARHRRAHLPSLSPLTTLAPPPPSFSVCPRRRMVARRPTSPPRTIATPRSRPSSRAARCARFACNQRALRGHSEGTQRALRGIRGT
jgi:hypothetical protein